VTIKVAIPKEVADSEPRVAVSPETVKKLTALGAEVVIESGAGEKSSLTDEQYKEAGGKIVKTPEDIFKKADIVLKVRADEKDMEQAEKNTLIIGLFSPFQNQDLINKAAEKNVISMAMELMPRITRAQSMDVLSSQSNLAGYKSVLDAAEHYKRAFPMMMTAAGSIAPAKVFIMGAGVAGLQAIATAKRLGAIVSATDVRPAAKEQVQSLGATFVAVEDDEFKEAETAGGYAKEMSKEYQKKQAELVEETIAKQDIVITTALIPGKPAPKLINEKMVKSMRPGSVIVDMAVDMGGNVDISEPGKVVEKHNVTIIGHHNIPGRLATDASSLYAKNLLNLLNLLINKETGKLEIDWEDEIVKNITLTKDGNITHPDFTEKKAPAKKKPADAPAKGKATDKKEPTAKDEPEKKTASGKE